MSTGGAGAPSPAARPGRPLLIDTDPGIDDALAILLACASPELDLRALVAVAGNAGLERTTRNALQLLELAGRTAIPVFAGASAPLGGRPGVIAPLHGTTGMDGADLPPPRHQVQPTSGVDFLAESLGSAEARGVTLAAIGPLTNVASALQRRPGLGSGLAELVIMGGATPKVGGNMSPYAEFNIFVDPVAASAVFSGALPITLVPLDLSRRMNLTPARIDRFAAIAGPVGRAVAGMLRHFEKGHGHLHDALTIAWLLRPNLFSGRRAAIKVETAGPRAGETLFDWREDGNCLVLLEGDAEAIFDLLIERLSRL